jgi:CheY-like chemotaxis protein
MLIQAVRDVHRSIPILLLSGNVGGLVTARAYNAGANEVLKKPLSARELAVTLARVLQH